MGAKAARMAIERSGLTKDDIDFIVFATLQSGLLFSRLWCADSRYVRYADRWGFGC